MGARSIYGPRPRPEPVGLTHLLSDGRCHEAKALSRVTLPGLEDLDIESYSGYLTVNESRGCNLFFWLFPATKVPLSQAPLIVYLNGGPGNSSLIGLFEEIGPIKVDEKGQVTKREVTWTNQFSVLFIDNPVGVGFSYCLPGAEAKTNRRVTDDLLSFLDQFLRLFLQHRGCDMYIGGMSYAGKYVPLLAHTIATEGFPHIKLKGIFIGGGLCDPEKMLPVYPKYLECLGMLSKTESEMVKEKIEFAIERHRDQSIYADSVMDVLALVFDKMQVWLGYKDLGNVFNTTKYDWHFEDYLNQEKVQEALHVKIPREYRIFNEKTVMDMAADFFDGVAREFAFTMENYKVLLFSGQFDMIVSVPMTEYFLSKVECHTSSLYAKAKKKQWISPDGEVAGYVTKCEKFTRVVMRNAGHRAAKDQPEWTLDMIARFIYDQNFNDSHQHQ